jgi:hypothetical protein
MLAALVAVLSGAARRFHPLWLPLPLVGVCFLIAIEAGFIRRNTSSNRLSLGERLRYLAPEILVLAVAMRIVATLSLPDAHLDHAVSGWLFDPLSAIDPLFVLYLLIGLGAGLLAHANAGDMALIEPRPGDALAHTLEDHERYAAFLSDERNAALGRLVSRFVGGGIVLLLALSLEAANFRDVDGQPQPLSDLSTSAAMIFLVSGFVLHSRARLALLQSRWQLEGATVAPSVARRWSSGSLLVVLGVLAIAVVLPRAYGMQVLDVLRSMLGTVGYAIALAGYIITWLFGMLLLIPTWLLSLVMINTGSISAAAPMVLPTPPPAAESEPRVLPALIFWVCMLALAALATRALLQRHPRLLRGVWAWLVRVIRQFGDLFRGVRAYASLLSEFVAVQFAEFLHPSAPRVRRTPLRLDPRGQVAHYYRLVARVAGQAGAPRHVGQTPQEYRALLTTVHPAAADDVATLTERYVQALYGPQPVQTSDVRQARGIWERLRRMFVRPSSSPAADSGEPRIEN